MRFLAELGADPLLPNADDATPLIAAAGLGTRSPGEDAGTESEVVEALQVALELGNDINAVDKNGETAMHGAAYKNLPGGGGVPGRARREDRHLEPSEQAGLDAADDRGGVPVRQLQAVAGDGRGIREGHDRRGGSGSRRAEACRPRRELA